MSGFIRRFLADPGMTVLLEIESVNIIDLEPPASISGVGSGTVLLVGEFEDGPFAETTEVTSVTDLVQTFGQFGHTYASVPSNNPAARERKADGALVSEKWNGNGFLALSGKKFRRLLICRVDTSVGSVEFRRVASLVGNNKQSWNLEPGQTLVFSQNGGADETITFNATAGVVTGAAAAFAGITAGEFVTLGDSADADIVVVFQAGDTTVTAVVARINAFFGYTFASDQAGQLRLTSRIRGSSSQVRIGAASAGTLADLGLVAGNTPGTGNVANIDVVTLSEVATVVAAGTAPDVIIARDPSGKIRAAGGTAATGSLEIQGASTATDFGFTLDLLASANGAANLGGTIPAGTRVRAAAVEWVTMQTITVPAGATGAGPFSVKIRPAVDDGTTVAAIVGAVNLVFDVLFDAFVVTNPLPVSAALSEAALDVQYSTALDSTLNQNSVARETNIIYSARQSNNVRRFLRDNALQASANGMFGRMAVVRPPQGTTRAIAQGDAEPGVGATRDQRVAYTYPQVRMFVPQVAFRGVAGGVGFTADGIINAGSDGFLASIMSQLAPEENPGQLTTFLGAVVGLETGAPTPLTIADYTNFRSEGIVAPRISEGTPIFQSGVTSVDPSVSPQLRNIARRRMADFIQDSLARRMLAFQKKLNTTTRRNAIVSEINAFLSGLLSPNNTALQRIEGYEIDQKSGNTPASLAAGMFRVIIRVRTLSSLDSIVLQTEIGESVEIAEAA